MSTSGDRSKRGPFRKKRYWALAIFVLIIIAAVASGGSKKPSSSSINSATPTTSVEQATSPSTSTSSRLAVSEQNAIEAAKQYLETSAFSRQGLIDQLDSSAGSGFSVRDATAAVDSLNVNWNAEAVRSARQYLQTSSFSCAGLVEQLSSSAGSEFTEAQARYAARKVGLCGTDSSTSSSSSSSDVTVAEQNAIKAAKQYLETSAFSRQGLIDQLDSSAGSGFSVRDATAAVDSLNVNWNAEAVRSARQYLQTSSFSCAGLVEQLSSSAGSEFTEAQARYAAQKVGLC